MSITLLAECPVCGIKYKNPRHDHEGKKVVCRCGAIFVLESGPRCGRNGGCVYNILSVEEDKISWERVESPGGIIRQEFLDCLKKPEISKVIADALNQGRKYKIDEDTVYDLIERLEWEKEDEGGKV
jgi:hypothetical protein